MPGAFVRTAARLVTKTFAVSLAVKLQSVQLGFP
jgi:hypothetical protein